MLDKKYQIIYADPPWDYGKMKPRKQLHRGGNPMSHYKVMAIEEICALPIEELSQTNSALFLWVTNPKLQFGFTVMKEWGFKYQTTITWVKTTQIGSISNNGLGFYFRGATEHILMGTKGRFSIPTNKRLPNVFMSPRSEHSQKPHYVYDMLESISDGPYIELFARNKHDKWDSWGNEVASDIEL